MKAKRVYEFLKTGDVKSSLGIGIANPEIAEKWIEEFLFDNFNESSIEKPCLPKDMNIKRWVITSWVYNTKFSASLDVVLPGANAPEGFYCNPPDSGAKGPFRSPKEAMKIMIEGYKKSVDSWKKGISKQIDQLRKISQEAQRSLKALSGKDLFEFQKTGNPMGALNIGLSKLEKFGPFIKRYIKEVLGLDFKERDFIAKNKKNSPKSFEWEIELDNRENVDISLLTEPFNEYEEGFYTFHNYLSAEMKKMGMEIRKSPKYGATEVGPYESPFPLLMGIKNLREKELIESKKSAMEAIEKFNRLLNTISSSEDLNGKISKYETQNFR